MTTCPRCQSRAALPGATSGETLACVMCGHREYSEKGRAAALPAVAEKRRYRPREGSRWTKGGASSRADWGSSGMSRTRRFKPVTLAPDALI